MFSLMTPRVQGPTHICSEQKCLINPTRNVLTGLFTKSKHPSWITQKIMIVPEHLLQNLEKENRLTSPPQLATFTRFLHISFQNNLFWIKVITATMRRLVFRRTISHKYNKQILICCLSLRISSTMPLLHTWQLSRFPGSLLVGHKISQSPTLRAESLSIFIDKSGRGKKTLLTACTFHIEHALTVNIVFDVSHS